MPATPKNQTLDLLNDASSLSPSSVRARGLSDASAGYAAPPPPSAPPPSTAPHALHPHFAPHHATPHLAPALPPAPQPTVDTEVTPEPTSSGYFSAAMGAPGPVGNSSFPLPPRHVGDFRSRFAANRTLAPHAAPQRFTMTAPVSHALTADATAFFDAPPLPHHPLPPAVSDNPNPPNHLLNKHSHGSSNDPTIHEISTEDSARNLVNTNSVSTDLSLPSQHAHPPFADTTVSQDPTSLRSQLDHDPPSNPHQEIFDPSSLCQTGVSDADWAVSSAEPHAIHAAASPHIDEHGLEYNFTEEAKIGQGTYGSVYIGRYFGENVAIKRIRIPSANPNAATDPFVLERQREAIRQFAHEIRKYERVTHPSIVHFYGVTLPLDEPSALLITEFMAGDSLSVALNLLRRTKFKFEAASVVRIAMQACGGLRALHSHNCIWGDVKPENILLSENLQGGVFPPTGDARIADFGLSKSASETLLADTTIGGSQPAGTYRYMSPESFHVHGQEDISKLKASDIYSFGIVIYEMMTLRVPWKKCTMSEIMNNVKCGKRPEWPVEGDNDYESSIESELRAVVDKCWLPDYRKRPSAEELFNALENSLHDVTMGNGTNHRPLSVLAENSSIANAANTEVRDPSVVSTVVPIGGSVELGSQALGSTTESRRIGEVPDDHDYGLDELDVEAVLTDGAESAPVQRNNCHSHHRLPRPTTTPASTPGVILPDNPTVSPVTSPEPRGRRHSQLDGDSTPQEEPEGELPILTSQLDQFNFQSTTNSCGTESQTATMKHMPSNQRPMANNTAGSSSQMMGDRYCMLPDSNNNNNSTNNFAGNTTNSIPFNGTATSSTNGLQQQIYPAAGNTLDSAVFIKNRAEFGEFAVALGRFAVNGTDEEQEGKNIPSSANAFETPSARSGWDNQMASQAINGPLAQQNSNGTNMGSNMSSSISSSRSKRNNVQVIIEEAAKEFLAYRKMKASRITPQARRMEQSKQKEEAERIKNEKESLSTIDRANESRNYSVILQEMRENRKSQTVVRAGMTAMENYCADENIYLEICEERGVEELVSGASLHGKHEPDIAIWFCKCIFALSNHCNDNVGHILRAIGVPSIVIEKMQEHPSNIDVQRTACDSLASIAASSELSRSAVATLGGPLAVYMAMTKNNASFHDPHLAKSALEAIRCIAQDNEKAAEYLVQVSALDTVSRAAEVFTNHGLDVDILNALRAFSFYDGGRRNVIMSSGLKALTLVMVRNTEPDFIVQCCTFIRAIARWRDHECEAAMLESCISSRIVMFMEKSNDIAGEDGAKVAWYSSHACTFLASFGSRSRQRLKDEGAIQTAIDILRNRKENARVVHSATDALAELLKGEEESKKHAEAHHVIEALNEALVEHRHVVRVRKALEWTLNYLTSPTRYEMNNNPIFTQLLQPSGQGGQLFISETQQPPQSHPQPQPQPPSQPQPQPHPQQSQPYSGLQQQPQHNAPVSNKGWFHKLKNGMRR